MSSEARWDAYFMKMAYHVASKSKDRSIKVGCVAVGDGNSVLSTGYNGFPRGVDDENEEYHTRPAKYDWTEHAERNTVYNAARNGIRLLYSTVYSTSLPCADCARAFVQSGVRRLVIPNQKQDAMTGKQEGMEASDDTYKRGNEIIKAGGIVVVRYVI